MPVHPKILSAAALRHVRQGSKKPPGQLGASDLPPMAVSWATTARIPVGTWAERQPRYVRGLSPCLTHCPVGNDVEGFVSRARDGSLEEAARILAAETPFPAVCGRVCYHPCETACNRVKMDGAVGIRAIERHLGDQPIFGSSDLWQTVRPSTGKQVAVVGAGPGGLSAAWGLALLGHQVDVLEKAEQPGGLLRYGIPSYRLPKDVLDREIERVAALGVTLHCGASVGEDRGLGKLLEEYDAVFVASGAARSRSLGMEDESASGCWSALAFLSGMASRKQQTLDGACVVVGGGNSAVDAARTARRLGASKVTILYRRSRAEMPAYRDEIEDALEEGVELLEQAIPLELEVENGRLNGVKCLRTRPGEPDDTGRRTPVPVPDSEFTLAATTLVNALGEDVSADDLTRTRALSRALSRLDSWGESMQPGLFAGGDFAGSERTVAHAIGGGKRAAMAIDRHLTGQPEDPLERFQVGGGPASLAAYLDDSRADIRREGIDVVAFEDLNPDYFPRAERGEISRQLSGRPVDFAEVEEGFTAEQAREEAARCFSCARCTHCGLCQIFCPEGAVHFNPETGERTVDSEHCKGCGICVEECPRHAVEFRTRP
jgi:NADPH-dependent glutamate synthase beta subunit-like oxidoreductase